MKILTDMNWTEVIELHGKARASFADAASWIPPEEWIHETEPDKWTPAHVLTHLKLVYEVLLDELNGGPGMKIRTSFWQQQLLRFTMVPRLLRGEPFPKGARAPRETRPANVNPNQAEAIESFRKLAATFEEEMQKAHQKNPRTKLTHAYFGRSNLFYSVHFCARHVAHHAKMLGEYLTNSQ